VSWVRRATNLCRLLFRRQKLETELDAEVGAYFEILVDRYMKQGMSREEARRAARVKFEGPEQVKQKVREARMGATIEATLKDVRYAARMLRKNFGFAAVAVCSLAIGIGATSAIYSIADALLLRPLPVPKSGGVVAVTPLSDQMFAALNTISYPDYVDFRDRNRTFEGLVANSYSFYGFAPDRTTLPRMKFGMFVSGNFFQVLGVEPTIGRGFRTEEDQAVGRDAVALLSHDFWISEYDGRRSVIGEKIWLNGIEFTIIGIEPESFTGTDQFIRPALYVPLAMSPRLVNKNNLDQRQVRWLTMRGRLKPGVGIAQARADLSAIAGVLQKMYPQMDGNLRVKVESQLQYQTEFAPSLTALVIMLALLAICVLLVACANVAGLLLSRSSTRAREIAVRLAIGAGRALLVRQLLIENLLLAIGGGAAGLALAYAAVRLFNSLPLGSDVPLKFAVQLDSRGLLFTVGVSILSTFLFGLAPALRTTRPDLVPALKATDAVTSKKGRLWGRNLLVGGQIALSFVLLIVSGVLVEGFRAELARGPGFQTSHLFLMSLNTDMARYTDAQREAFYKRLLDKTRLAPGVKSAALASAVPMAIGNHTVALVPEGYQLKPGQEAVNIFHNVVSDGYFETMEVTIVHGRSFLESDRANTSAVAVVNEQFAHHYWPNQNPLGKRFHLRNTTGKLVEIVGVAATTKYVGISEPPLDFVYLPFNQNQQSQMSLVAESKAPDATTLFVVLRSVIQEIDRNTPVFDARSMKDLYNNRAVKFPNLITLIVAALGFMGLLLAVVGLYGLVAYSVSRRTREIGIRMAIGADRSSVSRMVLRQGLVLGIAGVAVGSVIGAFASRAITSMVFSSLEHPSVLPFAAVSLLLVLTTMGATYLPARRASSIDPIRALRDE
jgi:macrolide transport system ATP-binding/permease protein